MRAIFLAAALLLLAATGVDARRRNPFAAPLPAARTRAFAGQALGDCSSAEFRSMYRATDRACESPNVTGAFDNFTSVDEADAAWGKLCESDCFQMIIDLRTGEYGNCLPNEVIEFIMEIAVLCRKDKAGTRCGAVLTETSQIACYVDPDDKKPATTCGAIGQCAYKDGICYTKPSQTYLKSVCGGGCIAATVATLASTSSSLATVALMLQQQICPAEADGNYCLAVLSDEMYDLTVSEFQQGIPSASVKSICESDAKRRCVKRVYGGRLESQRRVAEEQFFQCVAAMYEGYIRDPKGYNVTEGYRQCQGWYFLVYSVTAYVTAAELDQMCTKNAEGEYCVGLMGDYSAGDIVTDSTCVSYVNECFFNCKCSAKCVTQLEAAVEKFGCCLGTLQSIYGSVPDLSYFDPNDIPTLEFNPDDYASSSDFGSSAGSGASGSSGSGSGSDGSLGSGSGSDSASSSFGSGSGSGSSGSGSSSSGSSGSGSSSSGSSRSGSGSGSGSSGSSSGSGSGSSSSGSGSSSSGSSGSGSSSSGSGSGSSGSGSGSSGSSSSGSSGSGSSGSGSSGSNGGSGSIGSGSGSGPSGSGIGGSGSEGSDGSGSSSGDSDVVEKLSFGLFRNYQVCKSSKILAGLDKQLRQLCPTPLASPTVRDMPIGLDYEALSSDAALQARLISKLNNDIAVLFGLNADDIRTSLSDATPAGRHMSAMASPSTNVKMSMRSQSAADGAAAGSQFDAAQQNKSLVLPSTTRMVAKECKNCAPGGAASLQSGADTSAIPQPPTLAPTPVPGRTPTPANGTSSASATRALLAVMAAILLSLIHLA